MYKNHSINLLNYFIMKKIEVRILIILLTMCFPMFTSCSSDDSNPVTFELSTNYLSLSNKKDAEGSFTITTNGKWNITNVPSFVRVSSTSGLGNASIKVRTLADNKTAQEYTDVIVVEVEGGSSEKSITIVQEAGIEKNCYAEPANMLILSDGLAYNWNCGNNTQYFYDGLFTLSYYNKLSDEELISEVVTGNVEDRTIPDNENYACYYNLQSNTQYVYVTVSFAANGKQGEIIITPITTKSSNAQPIASIKSCTFEQDNDGEYYYAWDVKKNTYCSQYYTYAAASKSYFYTYYWLETGAHALLAWRIREEIKDNGETHYTRINDAINKDNDYVLGVNLQVLEQFTTSQINDGTTRLLADIYNDKYFHIVTWGMDQKGELSGMLEYKYFDLSSSESESNAKESKKLNVNRCYNTPIKAEPQKIVANKNDIELIRLQ